MLTEFGSDAFSAQTNTEDHATYLVSNWKEIYANACGLGWPAIVLEVLLFSSAMAGGKPHKQSV